MVLQPILKIIFSSWDFWLLKTSWCGLNEKNHSIINPRITLFHSAGMIIVLSNVGYSLELSHMLLSSQIISKNEIIKNDTLEHSRSDHIYLFLQGRQYD